MWLAGLLLLAALGPWMSFPSGFMLGAACLAMLLAAGSGGGWERWWALGAVVAVGAISASLVWHVHAQFLYYPWMNELWGPHGYGGFPDWSRPGAVLSWVITRPVLVGHYATTGMGVPLALLAFAGLVGLSRYSPPLAVLLSAPLVLALGTALADFYPLANRTLFFLAPCVWLLAAYGIESLDRRLRARRMAALILAAALLLPGVIRMSKYLVLPIRSSQFREAFQFAHDRWRPGDIIWVSHAEVYQAYYGMQVPVLRGGQLAELQKAARSGRVWMIATLDAKTSASGFSRGIRVGQ
jgi:hypothetical protein